MLWLLCEGAGWQAVCRFSVQCSLRSITVKAADGAVVAYGEFAFDIGKEKMYLTIAEDGRMTEE